MRNVSAGYGAAIAIRDISLEVTRGQVRVLLGANGSGKTTLLRAISGFIRIASGEILLEGRKIDRKPTHELAAMGMGHCLEGRRVFPFLSVADNLAMGGWLCPQTPKERLEFVFSLFPILHSRRKQRADTLSGGERQMLAIGQTLMMGPKMLLLDEPSAGLAPAVVAHLGQVIHQIAGNGVAVLWAEQNAKVALEWSEFAYVLSLGSITLSGQRKELKENEKVKAAYLGLVDRKSRTDRGVPGNYAESVR